MGGEAIEATNPAMEETLGHFPRCGPEHGRVAHAQLRHVRLRCG